MIHPYHTGQMNHGSCCYDRRRIAVVRATTRSTIKRSFHFNGRRVCRSNVQMKFRQTGRESGEHAGLRRVRQIVRRSYGPIRNSTYSAARCGARHDCSRPVLLRDSDARLKPPIRFGAFCRHSAHKDVRNYPPCGAFRATARRPISVSDQAAGGQKTFGPSSGSDHVCRKRSL